MNEHQTLQILQHVHVFGHACTINRCRCEDTSCITSTYTDITDVP